MSVCSYLCTRWAVITCCWHKVVSERWYWNRFTSTSTCTWCRTTWYWYRCWCLNRTTAGWEAAVGFLLNFVCFWVLSSSGVGSFPEGTPELLVQSEGVLPGQDHGWCSIPGNNTDTWLGLWITPRLMLDNRKQFYYILPAGWKTVQRVFRKHQNTDRLGLSQIYKINVFSFL